MRIIGSIRRRTQLHRRHLLDAALTTAINCWSILTTCQAVQDQIVTSVVWICCRGDLVSKTINLYQPIVDKNLRNIASATIARNLSWPKEPKEARIPVTLLSFCDINNTPELQEYDQQFTKSRHQVAMRVLCSIDYWWRYRRPARLFQGIDRVTLVHMQYSESILLSRDFG